MKLPIRVALALALCSGLLGSGSLAEAQKPRGSWTADVRDFAPGDLLTVLIDEYTLAASNQGEYASDRSFRELGVQGGQNLSGSVPNVRAEVGSSAQAETRRRGEATRQNRFQGEMTVRVVGIEPGGALRVEGRKTVHIDRTSEELLLRGIVRPQDIRGTNVIDSWRIAEPELIYTSRMATPRGGLLGRLLGAIWP